VIPRVRSGEQNGKRRRRSAPDYFTASILKAVNRLDQERAVTSNLICEPTRPIGADPQRPHTRDEIYIVQSGSSEFVLNGERMNLTVGDAVFVPAGTDHRFENFSAGFGAWVVFWGSDARDSLREADHGP
jgi:mannose-6-phosphate isomerase-like protein (cupin superfamily)